MLDRLLTHQIRSTKHSVLLLGPRQVGKSTLCRSLDPQLTVSLASEATYFEYKRDLRRLEREVATLKSPSVILIDEVQRAPELLNTIQHLIDTSPIKHRYLLTGSSAKKLRRGGANLLPGRVVQRFMTPLLWAEVGTGLDLDRAISGGMLPGVYLDRDSGAEILRTYTDLYLREEIQAEGIVRNIGGFARLLDVVANVSGQWLNYSNIASDCEINKESVRTYISILEDTLLLHRIPAFSTKELISSRKVSQRDKILLFDIGVRNALLGVHNSTLTPEERGRCFEQWCILQVIYLNATNNLNWRISSFLDTNGNEVDLVVETKKATFGIEIKSGERFRDDWPKGLRRLKEIFPKRQFVLRIWNQGHSPQRLEDGIEVVHFLHGLEEMMTAE